MINLYILKPVNLRLLRVLIEKVEVTQEEHFANRRLNMSPSLKKSFPDHQIAIPSSDGFVFVKVSSIIYLESEGAYTKFFLRNNEKITTSKNIKEYEDLLADHNYFRIHKSYIINMSEIVKYVRGEGGYVLMSIMDKDNRNKALDVSRRRKDDFLKMLYKA